MALRETRPVTFTRCGYAICIPRLPTMTSIFRPLSDAAANKENSTTPRALSSSLPTLATYPIRVLTIRLGTAASIHLVMAHLISLLDKEAQAGHECRGYRHVQPAPTYPSSLHTYAYLELNLPCTASTCILLCHQAICSKPQISKDLSHLLSSGAASRFQNAPRCSGVDVRMAADRVRCHVRLTPHRFFVRQSLDLYCAIEVVPSRSILETTFSEPHVICMP